MDERTNERGFESKVVADEGDEAEPLERALRERLRSVRDAGERRTIAGLLREASKLPVDVARAALEVGAGLAALSLRAGVEFLRAVPEAARVLDAEELRAWGEMGRRLTMADAETGVAFITSGTGGLAEVPRGARLLLLQVCARQLSLSTSFALETYRQAPEVARAVGDAELLRRVFEVALEVARRSARHSSDFLAATPTTAACLSSFVEDEDESPAVKNVEGGRVWDAALGLADSFAQRVGGIAADMWAALPPAVASLSADEALRLFRQAEGFLDRGGAAALHVLASGGEVLRLVPEAFDAWGALLRTVAGHNNACLVALARTGPASLRSLAEHGPDRARLAEVSLAVIDATHEVARVDAEAAISCFRAAPRALRAATLEQFKTWAREGLLLENLSARARRSYFALETRKSNEQLQGGGRDGLALEEVAQTLRLYVEALTGRAVEVAPLAAIPEEQRIGDGRTIHLPSAVSEFGDGELDFRLYKVLAAHAAGQIEFGTHEPRHRDALRAAYTVARRKLTRPRTPTRSTPSRSTATSTTLRSPSARSRPKRRRGSPRRAGACCPRAATTAPCSRSFRRGVWPRASSGRLRTGASTGGCDTPTAGSGATSTSSASTCAATARASSASPSRSSPSSCSSRSRSAAARSTTRARSTARSSRSWKQSSSII